MIPRVTFDTSDTALQFADAILDSQFRLADRIGEADCSDREAVTLGARMKVNSEILDATMQAFSSLRQAEHSALMDEITSTVALHPEDASKARDILDVPVMMPGRER